MGGGGRFGGVVFGSISCSTFTHYQSLAKPVTFKTMFNVYELASFKTIIYGRGEWWYGGSRGQWWSGVVGLGGGRGRRVGVGGGRKG